MSGRDKGRKFTVLIICVVLWLINISAVSVIYWEFQSVPMSLGLSLGAITAVFPGYLGVNAWQKKIQGGQMATSEVS